MIGIFDSGYGGLTVMKEIVAQLPQYDYVYLGDNARAPYGNRSREVVTEFTRQAVEELFERGAKLIIVACFTASSLAVRQLQDEYLSNSTSRFKERKILGVVRPIVEEAAAVSRFGRIGVIGTRGTIASNAFGIELVRQKEGLTVTQRACPLLVPLIEEGWHTRPEANMILKKYLRPLKSANIDTLLLGCTHYPLMMPAIEHTMGKHVHVLNSGRVVAKKLVEYLGRHPEIESQLTRGASKKFLTTDDAERFNAFVKDFAEMGVVHAQKVSLKLGPVHRPQKHDTIGLL